MNQRGFVLPTFNAYGILFGIIVALSFALTFSIHQTRSIQSEYDQYKADVSTAQEKLKEEHDRVLQASEQASRDATVGWSAALDRLHSRPVIRVSTDCHSGEMPGLSAASTGATGLQVGSGAGGISISIRQCETLANNSLEDDAWIRTAKRWVANQHEVSK